MKAVGYVRVSTDEQANSGLSLTYQREKINAYCVATDLELVTVIEDAGKSAKNMNRNGLQTALEMIRRGEVEALVILKLDRLTRSVKDLGTIIEFFAHDRRALVSVQDSINTTTAAGRLVLNVLGSVAQWEREAIGERVKAAWTVKRGKGEKCGKEIPFGYRLGDDGKTLILHAKEQEAVKTMLRLRARGLSLRKIGEELSRRGIETKNGGQWHAQTIKQILGATAQ
jgi:DNA invertase Pin-like site-specific DNA recombinase